MPEWDLGRPHDDGVKGHLLPALPRDLLPPFDAAGSPDLRKGPAVFAFRHRSDGPAASRNTRGGEEEQVSHPQTLDPPIRNKPLLGLSPVVTVEVFVPSDEAT